MQGPPNHVPSFIEEVCEKYEVVPANLATEDKDNDKQNKSPNLLTTATTTSNPVGYDLSYLRCDETIPLDLHNTQDTNSLPAEATTKQPDLGQVPLTDLPLTDLFF